MDFQDFKKKYQKISPEEVTNATNSEPLVSICVQTYQHANFIKDCLDGILMQETSFPFEILLGEDDSTDGTREICRDYAEKYPDKIRLLLHRRENNIKINGQPTGRFNFIYNMFSARGKYVTFCEGDDYWIDPVKLQKQVDFLEQNKDFVLCYHDAISLDENGINQSSWLPKELIGIIETVDLKKSPFILLLTTCFRNVIKNFPPEFFKVLNADKFLVSLLGDHGKARFVEEIKPAVYRLHEGGIVSLKSEIEKEINHLGTFNYLFQYYLKNDDQEISSYFKSKFKNLFIRLMDGSNKLSHDKKLYNLLFSLEKNKAAFYYASYIITYRTVGRGNFLRRLLLKNL